MNIKTENHIYQIRPYAFDLLAKIFIKNSDGYSYIGTIINKDKNYIKKILIEHELTGKNLECLPKRSTNNEHR